MAGTWTTPSPAIPTFVDGMTSTLDPLNNLTATAHHLYDYTQGGFRVVKPLCVVYQLKNQGFPPNNTDALVDWDSVYANTEYMFVTSRDDTITARTPGWYRLSLQVHFDTTGGGARACKILVNGTSPVNAVATDNRNPLTTGEGTTLFCTALASLAVGSVVHANIFQSSGALNGPTINTFSASFLSAEWIAPL